jgi:hypothetical protein
MPCSSDGWDAVKSNGAKGRTVATTTSVDGRKHDDKSNPALARP